MGNKRYIFTPAIYALLSGVFLAPMAVSAPEPVLQVAEADGQHMVEIISPDGQQSVRKNDVVHNETEGRKVYGPISGAETLWAIATRFRPAKSVTVHQTTLAIYKLNPHAFRNENINSIIKGSAIRLPTLEDVQKVSQKEALAKLRESQASLKAAVTTPDGKRVVKLSPKGESRGYAQVKNQLSQANVIIKQQKQQIAQLESALQTAQSKKGATETTTELEMVQNQLIEEQQKVGHLTELNFKFKNKSIELEAEQAALEQQVAELKTELETAQQPQEITVDLVDIEPVEPPAKPEGLYESLVLNPLYLGMIAVVYALLLLAIVAIILRVKAKKEIEEQEKDLAESPLGVMENEEGEFDSLLTEELDESKADTFGFEEVDLDETIEEQTLTDELPDLDTGDSIDELPEFTEELADMSATADSEEISEELENVSEDIVEEERSAEDSVETDFGLDEFSESVDLSEFDEQAPDLVPPPSKEPETNDIELELSVDAPTEPEPNTQEPAEQPEPEVADEWQVEPELDEEPQPEADGVDDHIIEFGLEPTPETAAGEEPSVDNMSVELDDADIAESTDTEKPGEFVDIEKLMDKADEGGSEAEPYETPSLDVGLDEFPDMLSSHEDVDVDGDNSGVNTQLDLARAYLEIDDKAGAKAILQEVLEKGNEAQVAEAQSLIDRITS